MKNRNAGRQRFFRGMAALLCMLLLGKAHVGEVQVSLWDDDTVAACEKAGIALL